MKLKVHVLIASILKKHLCWGNQRSTLDPGMVALTRPVGLMYNSKQNGLNYMGPERELPLLHYITHR